MSAPTQRPGNSSPQEKEGYELVFEGPQDATPETLRKLRGSLLSQFNLSAENAKRILEQAPLPLKRASTPEELKPYYELLKRSGAKVFIVEEKREQPDLPSPKDATAGNVITLVEVVEEPSPAPTHLRARATASKLSKTVSIAVAKKAPKASTSPAQRCVVAPSETLLSILLSLVVLVVGNLLFVPAESQTHIDKDVIEAHLKTAMVLQGLIPAEQLRRSPESSRRAITLSGKATASGQEITSQFEVTGRSVTKLALQVTASAVHRQNLEEGGLSLDSKPRLQKIELGALQLTTLDDGLFYAEGGAQAFVEHNDQLFRFPAVALIRGEYDAASKLMRAKVRIRGGDVDSSASESLALEEVSQGEYRFALSTEITAAE